MVDKSEGTEKLNIFSDISPAVPECLNVFPWHFVCVFVRCWFFCMHSVASIPLYAVHKLDSNPVNIQESCELMLSSAGLQWVQDTDD
uniref:Uncharacterized protein n=1 Tax=Arundo donax TaxID=35708 RepID=A0A0A9D776_ARUDO